MNKLLKKKKKRKTIKKVSSLKIVGNAGAYSSHGSVGPGPQIFGLIIQPFVINYALLG